jgi:AraC family transcriptional regulator, arabinose operon regulatory protein
MDYPAAMTTPARAVTGHVPASPITCDEFRKGRGYTNWRPSGSGDWLLIFTRAGLGRVRTPREELLLGPGDAILYSPSAAQDYATDEAVGHWHLRWAHFEPRAHWRLWLRWPQVAPGTARLALHGPAESSVNSALGRMLAARRLGGADWQDLAMNALEEALIWTFRVSSAAPMTLVDERVQRAATYLAAHPSEPFDLARLARLCGLSPSRLSHLFRAELDTTPQRFGEKIRLDLAHRLLAQTNLPVAEVAREAGFEDALYFSRRFRRAFGHPPSEVRTRSPS